MCCFLIPTYEVLVDKQMCFEIHHYLQNNFYLRKNYNLLLLGYSVSNELLKILVLFEVIRLLKLVGLLSKSALFSK